MNDRLDSLIRLLTAMFSLTNALITIIHLYFCLRIAMVKYIKLYLVK